MYKELRYFNGEKVVRLVKGVDGVEVINDKKVEIQVVMKDGTQHHIRSNYIEVIEKYEERTEPIGF